MYSLEFNISEQYVFCLIINHKILQNLFATQLIISPKQTLPDFTTDYFFPFFAFYRINKMEEAASKNKTISRLAIMLSNHTY